MIKDFKEFLLDEKNWMCAADTTPILTPWFQYGARYLKKSDRVLVRCNDGYIGCAAYVATYLFDEKMISHEWIFDDPIIGNEEIQINRTIDYWLPIPMIEKEIDV